MSKYIEIRKKLTTIEQGRFQLLCIDYLYNNIKGIAHSPGTVRGKEKTKKGRPDIYLVTENSRYILAECTTLDDSDKKKFAKKLHKDLDESLDCAEIGIEITDIDAIYLLCSSDVEPALVQELTKKGLKNNIKVQIVGLTQLAAYYASVGRVFAQEFLQVQFLTGQVLSKEQFIAQYGKRNISTPLDNQLLGREKELDTICRELEREDLIILSGKAGVGKSRLAIAALDHYHKEHPEFLPYYIFQKNGEIASDLATFLKPGNSYILLVDDANRQKQNLLAVLNQRLETDFRVKILMTVRDYAVNEVIDLCSSYRPSKFKLNRIPSEIIAEIIRKEPFSPQNYQIEQRIVELSNGNPRLAIMAANVMRENPDIVLLKDVTSIYDEYFESTLKENEIFQDKLTVQVLGIIGFFYTLDLLEVFDCDILKNFGVNKEKFMARALELEELEIVDIYENSVVKISDQILSTYFFFNAFLRQHLLSLPVLLEKYHSTHFHRFRETFLACIETFGPAKTVIENEEVWLKFWDTITDKEDEAIKFMQIFALYFTNQLFAMFRATTKKLPDPELTNYEYSEYRNAPSQSDKDRLLNLLEPYLTQHNTDFETAVFLAFEYVKRQRSSITALIDLLKKSLYINSREIASDFKRILFLYNFLEKNFDKDQLYSRSLYAIMDKVILASAGRIELYEKLAIRHRLLHSISNLRNRFLSDLDKQFPNDRKIIFALLKDYIREKRELRYPELESDQKMMLKIFGNHFSNKEFGDCYLIQGYYNLLKNNGAEISPEILSLRRKYNTAIYRQFKVMQIYDSDEKEMITNYNAHYEKKKLLIEKKFPIKDLQGFKKFYMNIDRIREFLKFQHNLGDGICIVIESCFVQDISLGLDILRYYLDQGNQFSLNGIRIYRPVYETNIDHCLELYSVFENLSFENADRWRQNFFDYLPEKFITSRVIELFFDFYKKVQSKVDIYLNYFLKYEQHSPGLTAKVLGALTERREADKNFVYKLEYNFFKNAGFLLEQDFVLCKKLYLQQEVMPEQYDPDGRELFILITYCSDFFEEYMEFMLDTDRKQFINISKQMHKIWLQPDPEKLIFKGLTMINKVPTLYRRDHLGCIFFYGTDTDQKQRSFVLFQKIIKEYANDESMINLLFDTIRNSMPEYFKPAVRELLTYNQNIDFFNKIELHNNHFSYTGNEIWAEKKARDLIDIINYIKEMPNHYEFLEHQDSLQKQLGWENEDTKREKKYQFRGFR